MTNSTQQQFQSIKDQIALLRQNEQTNQWLLTIQSGQNIQFQGQGSNGFQEFKHFLLPDIVAHIYFLVDRQQLPSLHQKFFCRAVVITWIGQEATISSSDVMRLTQNLAFQDAFCPNLCHIVAQTLPELQQSLDDAICNANYSFKHFLEPIQNGFIVFTQKEKKTQPKIVAMVTQRSVQKQQMLSSKISEQREYKAQPRMNQPLVRQNPKLNQEITKLQENIKQVQNQTKDENSETLEDQDISMIQNLVASMGVMPKNPQKNSSLTQLQQVKTSPKEETKKFVKQKESPRPEPVKHQVSLQDKINSCLEFQQKIHQRFLEQKTSQGNQLLIDQLTKFKSKIDGNSAKATKQVINKAAMAFLIIESGKKGAMKKDFNQTLAAVKEFLPEGGDQVLKRLIQGANQEISVDEVINQLETWVAFLKQFFAE
uniref:Uncharacterized protein n=1 Tax=Trepomonas sp. PC1 TaxID=1076344 RepID=A0A146K378_9EUKA|eukprot:JAP91157.1 Hypothetical protein TPC1_17306 [Trepomonas sp. PC1]